MQPNTLTQREYKGKFKLRIFEKNHVGSQKIIGSTPLGVTSSVINQFLQLAYEQICNDNI
jgi:hypothetical protein